jgi:hypothetical protein
VVCQIECQYRVNVVDLFSLAVNEVFTCALAAAFHRIRRAIVIAVPFMRSPVGIDCCPWAGAWSVYCGVARGGGHCRDGTILRSDSVR